MFLLEQNRYNVKSAHTVIWSLSTTSITYFHSVAQPSPPPISSVLTETLHFIAVPIAFFWWPVDEGEDPALGEGGGRLHTWQVTLEGWDDSDCNLSVVYIHSLEEECSVCHTGLPSRTEMNGNRWGLWIRYPPAPRNGVMACSKTSRGCQGTKVHHLSISRNCPEPPWQGSLFGREILSTWPREEGKVKLSHARSFNVIRCQKLHNGKPEFSDFCQSHFQLLSMV